MSKNNQTKINEAVNKHKTNKNGSNKVAIKPMNSSIFNKSKEVLNISKNKTQDSI